MSIDSKFQDKGLYWAHHTTKEPNFLKYEAVYRLQKKYWLVLREKLGIYVCLHSANGFLDLFIGNSYMPTPIVTSNDLNKVATVDCKDALTGLLNKEGVNYRDFVSENTGMSLVEPRHRETIKRELDRIVGRIWLDTI